ncbi:hemerythrin domain-containing protein [Nonomuraea sp. NPDC049421]|uniref:hemerythrin domain-containing protein n=1 Tax=Nonomuraea sp. NPDC049421 TaxID=3155275 RepID=UPI00343B45C6
MTWTDAPGMAAMFAAHDRLRGEMTSLARLTVRGGRNPRRVLRTAAGWRSFKHALGGHFAAEDKALWPPLRHALALRPEGLALLEAIEAEHAALHLLIEAIDEQVATPSQALADAGPGALGDLTDSLVTGLTGHLAHEEHAALPLLRQTITPPQWARFAHLHTRLTAADAARTGPERWSTTP